MASIAALAESLKSTFADKVVETIAANDELTLVIRAADLLPGEDRAVGRGICCEGRDCGLRARTAE